MAEPRDIPDALRDAVERTVQATVGTRELAQGAASELSASVDDLVKGAEKGITRSRRTVRAAVGERLPASQDDMKAIRAELRRIDRRLEAIEERLPPVEQARAPRARSAKAASTPRVAKKPRATAKPKGAGSAKRKSGAGTKAKPQR